MFWCDVAVIVIRELFEQTFFEQFKHRWTDESATETTGHASEELEDGRDQRMIFGLGGIKNLGKGSADPFFSWTSTSGSPRHTAR